jgi:hypothetical protein
MSRWLLVLMIAHGEFSPPVTHRFHLDEIGAA